MADTNFVAGTVIRHEWLNDVNNLTYRFTNTNSGAIPRSATDKLQEIVSLEDFGAVGDDTTDDTSALQAAGLSGLDVFIPNNRTFKLNGSITLVNGTTFYGAGFGSQIKQYANAPWFIFPSSTDRRQKNFHSFACLANGNVAASQIVFQLGGTPNGAAISYTIGYSFYDITISNGESIGCGFYLSDTFRCSITDIGMTSVGCPIDIVGNTCQTTIRRVFNNNDAVNGSYGKNIGLDMTSKNSYLDGLTRVPENIQISNNGLVAQTIGARLLGLYIICENNDFDFSTTNGIIYAGGTHIVIDKNYVASSTVNAGYVGILVPNLAGQQESVLVRGNIINAYSSLSGASTAIRYGDGNAAPFSAPEGAVITDNFISAPGAYWEFGIDLDRNVKVTCNSNMVFNGSCRINAIRATNQSDTIMIGNDCGISGTIQLEGPTSSARGVALNNRGVMTVANIVTAGNWLLFNNAATGGSSNSGYSSNFLTGSTTYDPPSLGDGAGTTTTVTVTGAVVGDYTQVTFSNDLQGITVTSWISSANTVSVRFQNESGGSLDLGSGILRVKVTKVS